jgi:hypothetical protein
LHLVGSVYNIDLLLFGILDKDYFNINFTYFKGLLRTKFEELVLSCDSISKFRGASRGCCWWLEIGKYKDRIDAAGMILKPSFMKICELIQTFLGGGAVKQMAFHKHLTL